MSEFAATPVPPERHPTRNARASLSARLGFADSDFIQDWERHFADETRIGAFLCLYQTGDLDNDEAFLLMDLILASAAFAAPGTPSEGQWKTIESLIVANNALYNRTVWEWADIDGETGIPDSDFQISPRMQRLLCTINSDPGGL